MNPTFRRINTLHRGTGVSLSFAIMMVVGLIDYATGDELSFSAFYLVAIVAAFWFAGWSTAILVAVLSISIWVLGDWAAGMHKSLILAWNGVITLTFYLIVLTLLAWLKSSYETMEMHVRERTLALREEIAERERLEKEILRISESERQRIGCDLHDNLCQHLTGTAIAALNVEQDLTEIGQETAAADVRRLVALVEEGISLAREIARGLAPMHLEADGLLDIFQELAMTTRNHLKTDCRFDHDGTDWTADAATAIHLYRIAQEAVSNAVRHGKAKHIAIRIAATGGQVILTIEDDGCGLAAAPQDGKGMGLLIMKHRAAMIGASLSVDAVPAGGTAVTCTITQPNLPTRSDDDAL